MDEGAATAEIVRLMFGRCRPAASRAGRACPRAPHGSTRERCCEVRGLAVHDPQHGGRGHRASPWRRARSSASPASTATGRSSSPRRWPASGRPPPGAILLDGKRLERLDVGARRRLGLRYVTDDRLGEGTRRQLPRRDQFPAEGDRRAALLAARHRAAAARSRAHAAPAGPRLRRPHPRRGARRSAGCPAATSRRRCWRASCPARPRSSIFTKPTDGLDVQNIAGLAPPHPRRPPSRHGHDPDLDRPRRAAGARRPHRRHVARPTRRHGRANGDDARRRVGELMVGIAA